MRRKTLRSQIAPVSRRKTVMDSRSDEPRMSRCFAPAGKMCPFNVVSVVAMISNKHDVIK
jgi:hypothetical protein